MSTKFVRVAAIRVKALLELDGSWNDALRT